MGTISPPYSKVLGISIRSLRQTRGLTRRQFADRAGIGLSTLYLLEDGLIDTRLSTLDKLAHALGVTPDYLLAERKAA